MRQILLILLIFSLLLINAYAAELSLEECIGLALEKNSGLKSFEMDALASEADVKKSYTGFFPSLKLKGTYTLLDKPDLFIVDRNTFLTGIPPDDVELSAKNREIYGLSLGIEQPLFTGGHLTHTFRKSKILNEEARYSVERQKRLLIFEVKKDFYEALKEQLYRKKIEKTLEAKKERLRAIKELHREGYLNKEDILQQETDIAFTELESYKSNNREDFAISRLKSLMHYQDDEITLKVKSIKGFLIASLQEIKDSAYQNREDLKMSLSRIEAAGEDIEIAKSGFYPRASLEGRHTLQKETNVTRPEVWMFTAQIDWPIFEWGRTRSEVKRAEALNQKLKYEHEEHEKTIMLEVEQAWRVVKENEKEVEAKEKRLRTAEYRFNQAMERYTERVIKLVDLIEAETDLIKAYNEYIATINDLNISVAHLELSTSSSMERWFTTNDIYRPDLESFSKTLKELITKKSEAPQDKSLEKGRITPAGDSNRPAMVSEDNSIERTYVIQVGSFKTRQPADRLRKNLQKKIGDKKMRIYNHRGFYKVRIAGFRDKEDAEDAVRGLGIKDYLIVKASNGHRKTH